MYCAAPLVCMTGGCATEGFELDKNRMTSQGTTRMGREAKLRRNRWWLWFRFV